MIGKRVRMPVPLWLSAAVLYVFLYAPIAVVIVYSFNAGRHGTIWQGFTLDWYARLARDAVAWRTAGNTLILGAASTAIATLIGTMLGLSLSRHRFPGQNFFTWLLYVPVVIPEIVLGVALMLFYSLIRSWLGLFELGMTTMILGHVTFQIPFVAIVVRARVAGLDRTLEEAAQDLGANPWRTFWHVTFPLILPGVISGGMLAFTLSLDDFVVSFFTSGPGSTTLPILIYSSVKRGITPEINALSTIMILVSLLAIALVALLRRRRPA